MHSVTFDNIFRCWIIEDLEEEIPSHGEGFQRVPVADNQSGYVEVLRRCDWPGFADHSADNLSGASELSA